METDNTRSKQNNIYSLISIVLFALMFILGLTMLTYMIRPGGDTKNRFMGFYAEPKNSLDIVMIGSSPTYSSIVMPELYGEYGIKAYPLASNVQRPAAGRFLVKEARKTQSPSLYMFEMRMYTGDEESLTLNMGYTREVTDNMKYSFNRIAAINELVHSEVYSEDCKRYTYYFDIFKYHENWISLINLSQIKSFTYTVPDPYKGYKITDKVGPIETPEAPGDVSAGTLDPYQEKALKDLLDELDSTGARALFYLAPFELKEGDAEKFEYIKETVEARGYDYLDMNRYYDEIGIDFARDFSDYGIHTNAIGAKKCTEFMGEYLKSHYDIPDHRQDTDQDGSWQRSYENWQEEYDQAVITIDERIKNEDFFVLE